MMQRPLVKFHKHPNFDSLRSVSPSPDEIDRYISPIAHIKTIAYQGHLDARLDWPTLAEKVQQQTAEGSRFWFIIDTDDNYQAPIAFARTTKHSDRLGTIDEVLVSPAHLRKGLGSLVVHTALTRSFNLRNTHVMAPAYSAAASGAEFYTSIGLSEQSDPSQSAGYLGDSTAAGHATLHAGHITTVRDTIESKYSWISTF